MVISLALAAVLLAASPADTTTLPADTPPPATFVDTYDPGSGYVLVNPNALGQCDLLNLNERLHPSCPLYRWLAAGGVDNASTPHESCMFTDDPYPCINTPAAAPATVVVIEPDVDGNCFADLTPGDWVLSDRCPVIDLADVRLPVADGEPDVNGDGWVDGTEHRRQIDPLRPCTWDPFDEFDCDPPTRPSSDPLTALPPRTVSADPVAVLLAWLTAAAAAGWSW